ncbi:MAG: type I-C CRISPR-associated protein Cas8c/Csd1 [Chloroflexota bacterium]|nr:type I-C CRISPR-associated protein Cas8c/Csd1 [Chloroflexota bacterium]
MFLQRLKEYADCHRDELPPSLYDAVRVRYIIELDEEGRLLSDRLTDLSDPESRRSRRGPRMPMPYVKRTSGISPQLFCDTAPYTLDLPREGRSESREHGCHEAYMEMLERCAEATGEPAVEAVLRFLENDPLEHLHLPEDMDRGGNIIFRVNERNPADLPAVKRFWVRSYTGEDLPIMQCIVCGRREPVLNSLPTSVKGVPGAQASGAAIISANEEAYESYGLERSHIAPICLDCAESTTMALNRLLRLDDHHLRFSTGVYVFWTRGEEEWNPVGFLSQPKAEDVRALLLSVYSHPAAPVESSDFYAAFLTGSGGRVQVRDWLDTTVEQVQRHLAHWFQAQRIVGPWGEEPEPLGVYSLAGSTVRDLNDLPPNVLRQLVGTALTGRPLPPGLLHGAVQRTRAQQAVNRNQAALIKLVLSMRTQDADILREEDPMTDLDLSNREPAYLCGRLLAEIEAAQRAAIPGAKATVIDRFFGTASTAPASVFGNLLRGAQAHLGKLKRDRPGTYGGIQRRLEEIMSGLEEFPRTLSLDEQALFVLGYYHQRASDRAAATRARDEQEESEL